MKSYQKLSKSYQKLSKRQKMSHPALAQVNESRSRFYKEALKVYGNATNTVS